MCKTKRKLNIGIIGAGRIGSIHATTLSQCPNVTLLMIADPIEKNVRTLCEKLEIPNWTIHINEIFENKLIDAILICSPTEKHIYHVEMALKYGKHVFCEKPLDLDLIKIEKIIDLMKLYPTCKVMLGFNRRFDTNFLRIKNAINNNEIGTISMFRITSRDPFPPPIEYIKKSGGMFLDMTIHDFDMARFLINDEIIEVYAISKCIDNNIHLVGDIDSAIITLKFKNGVIGFIENSRFSPSGYDQRLEILGMKGSIYTTNKYPNNIVISTKNNIYKDVPYNFFLDRYKDSYIEEIKQFIHICLTDAISPITVIDGYKSLQIAKAAQISIKENRPVKLSEITSNIEYNLSKL